MPTIYYRTEDPIENLKIRVVVREISKAKIFNNDGSKIQPFFNEMTLSWQQKLYSPREISDYLRYKESKSGTAAQVEARRHFRKLEKNGDNVNDILDDVMLYTYVDKDNFKHESAPPLFDPGSQEPYVGAAVRTLGSVDKGTARQKGISNKLFRDKPFKAMHICMATDVDSAKLSAPLSIWDHENHFKEHILCSLRLYQDGLLEVTPSFSSVVEEAGLMTHEDCSGLGAFLDDHSAETGLKKGFRLATFRVRSAKGSEFEYAIQNVNDILIPHKLEQIEAKKAFVNSIKAAEVRGTMAGGAESWLQDPPSRDKTVGLYAELVSGRGFEGEKLFIAYEVTTPQRWLLRTGDLSDGVGIQPAVPPRSGNGQGASSLLEQQALKIADRKTRTDGDEGMLRGITHTAYVAHSLRTATTLPFLRPRWKGVHLSFAAGATTRIAFGATFFLISCFAVILGVSYPFWIVPALGIVFVLGTGVPGPPPTVVLMKSKHAGSQSNSSRAYATQPKHRNFTTQDREVVEDLEPARVAVFNHLMRFSFDVEEVGMKAGSSLAPSAHVPTIVFQVFSTDWLGRHKLEGYGYHHLSDEPGCHDLEVKTWRPVGNIRDQMQDFFLGNAAYLKDEHFVDSVNKTAHALNRFGVLTHSSGSVRIRVHTIVTDPRTVELHHQETAQLQQQQDSSLKVKRTVNDILQSFRTSISGTPRRMMSLSNSAASVGFGGIAGMASPGTPSGKGGDRPSVSNILSSLNVSARDAKLNDILARARAKAGKNGANAEGIAAAPKPSRFGANANANANVDSKFASGTTAAATQARGIAAMERLTSQLPDSKYGATPTASVSPKNRVFNTPSTPGGMPMASTVDTPFANPGAGANAQSYDPFIEKEKPNDASSTPGPTNAAATGVTARAERTAGKKVPPLGTTSSGGGGGAHAVTPAGGGSGGGGGGSGGLAPLTGSGSRGKLQPLGGGLGPATAATSARTTTTLDTLPTTTAAAAVAVAALGSAPNTARRERAHRYDSATAASEDENEASESLLGGVDLPPRLQALNLRDQNRRDVSASADTVLSQPHQEQEQEHAEEVESFLDGNLLDEEVEDTPLLGTLTR